MKSQKLTVNQPGSDPHNNDMKTYEIFDANPSSSGDVRWPDTISASDVRELEAAIKNSVDGNPDYPSGTRVWFIERADDGTIADSGSVTV